MDVIMKMKNRQNIKGQMILIEQFVLVILVIVGIIILLFYLANWKNQDIQQEKILKDTATLNNVAKYILYSPLFTKKLKILDGSKLTSLQEEFTCRELRDLVGANFILEIQIENTDEMFRTGLYIPIEKNNQIICNENNYPGCNRWEICKDNSEESLINTGKMQALFIKLPVLVNIYSESSIEDKNYLATMYLKVLVSK